MIEKLNDVTIEVKLKNLYKLQLIDSRIDEIKNLRGGLPLEIEKLKKEIGDLIKEISNLGKDIANIENEISKKRYNLKSSETLIKRYKIQQNKVRNNKELESLNKEIEYQELEVELFHKKIKEDFNNIAIKKNIRKEQDIKLLKKEEYLNIKKSELEKIILNNKIEEEKALNIANDISKNIEPKLLKTYQKIRKGVKNGMAVVPVKRGASMGSYLFIPPQLYSDLIQRKNIIIDEHSGRILIDSDLANEVEKEIYNF